MANAAQQAAMGKLYKQAAEAGHTFESFHSPSHELVRCTCGWSAAETHHQNALARTSRLDRKVREHILSLKMQVTA